MIYRYVDCLTARFQCLTFFFSLQFHFESSTNQHEGYYPFSIDDGCQPPVELISLYRDIIAATFTLFLLKNIGGSETFADKQDFFYHEVRKHHQKHYHEKLSMKVQRDKLLESVNIVRDIFMPERRVKISIQSFFFPTLLKVYESY